METIYSLVTKPINQNVAIIRISGPETFLVIKKMFPGIKLKSNYVSFQKFYINKKFIDEMLVLSFFKPNSFTGEDVVELQPHGNIFVVEKILSFLQKENLKQAKAGEFMKQAYMNNKIDLIQSEAINALILSNNKKLSEKALLNIDGTQSLVINQAIDYFSNILARIQVSIDYPENQDLPEYSLLTIKKDLQKYEKKLKKIIEESKSIIKVSLGIKIAIIGKPNAGKSSLLNALINEDKAIVSDIKGTTRDVVEASIYLNDVKVTFQDTAGLRRTKNFIEKKGVKKTYEVLEKADIIISIEEKTNRLDFIKFKKYEHKLIKVMNKKDLSKFNNKNYINISVKNNDIFELKKEITNFIKKKIIIKEDDNAILITQNQITKFNEVLSNIVNAIEIISKGYNADIVAFEIEQILKKLGIIIGKEIDQNYIANLFSSFCLGK